MAKKTQWIVTTSSDRPIAEVATELSKAGFEVSETLNEIGVIRGSFAGDKAASLRGIRGVADVAPETKIDVGPPGSPKTW